MCDVCDSPTDSKVCDRCLESIMALLKALREIYGPKIVETHAPAGIK